MNNGTKKPYTKKMIKKTKDTLPEIAGHMESLRLEFNY